MPQTLTVNTPIMWLYMILQLFIWKDSIYHASSTLAKLIEYSYTHKCNYPMQVNGNDPVHVNETLTNTLNNSMHGNWIGVWKRCTYW